MTNRISVTVPATTANLGPGLDCLGLALTLYNRVVFEETSAGLTVSVNGEGKGIIPEDETNLVVQAAERVFHLTGRRPDGLRVVQENFIPVSSGLGSSAAAVLGGILAANGMVGEPLDREELLALAIGIEGHPDNVTPALFGGLTLVVDDDGKIIVTPIPIPEMRVAVVMPEFNLTTAEARAALPAEVPLADAIYNAGRVGLLVRALETGDYDALRVATQDRLHQPYRLPLISGLADVFEAGRAVGAAAVALSGAGPSIIAFAPAGHQEIVQAMREAFTAAGLKSRSWLLSISHEYPVIAKLED
jgi:homoserine kinase